MKQAWPPALFFRYTHTRMLSLAGMCSQASLMALTALVERGLQPDLFLSFPSDAKESSTTLLATLVANYARAQQVSRRGEQA